MKGAKIYPQPRKIIEESLEFVDGAFNYDVIEFDS